MRVASYAQRTAATRASLVAILLLTLTILQGSSALLTLVYHFSKSLEPITALLWLMSYMVALGGLMLTHGLNWVFWLFRYRLLLVILLLGVIASIGWSVDANVSTTRVMHLIGSSLIAIYLGFMVPLAIILNVLAWVLGGILLASLGAIFALPALGIENYEGTLVWKGILTSKNTLGFWAAVCVLLYVSQWSRAITSSGKLVCIAMAMISFVILLASKSATSLLAMVIGGAVALYFYIAHRFQLGFVRMVVMALLFTGLIVVAFLNIDTAELVGRSGDLTGRGEVWTQTWSLILQKPLTGYGYGSIWNPNEATIWIQESLTDFTWVVYHAHNGFLQVASEIGLPLSLIAALMVVQQLIEIFYCQYQRQQLGVLFVLGFVLTYLISNYSEARFLVNRELFWILFITLPISMLRQVTVVLPDGDDMAHSDPDPDPTPGGGSGSRHRARPSNGQTTATRGPNPEIAHASARAAHAVADDGPHNTVSDDSPENRSNSRFGRKPAATPLLAAQSTAHHSKHPRSTDSEAALTPQFDEGDLDAVFDGSASSLDQYQHDEASVERSTAEAKFQNIEPDIMIGEDRFDKFNAADFDIDEVLQSEGSDHEALDIDLTEDIQKRSHK